MTDKNPATSKKVNLNELNSVIKHNSIKKNYRNGKIPVIIEGTSSDPRPFKTRVDSFGNNITSEKKHKIQICEQVKVIEVENWKYQNQSIGSPNRCSICAIM